MCPTCIFVLHGTYMWMPFFGGYFQREYKCDTAGRIIYRSLLKYPSLRKVFKYFKLNSPFFYTLLLRHYRKKRFCELTGSLNKGTSSTMRVLGPVYTKVLQVNFKINFFVRKRFWEVHSHALKFPEQISCQW